MTFQRPYIVYMLQDLDILEDWTTIRKVWLKSSGIQVYFYSLLLKIRGFSLIHQNIIIVNMLYFATVSRAINTNTDNSGLQAYFKRDRSVVCFFL